MEKETFLQLFWGGKGLSSSLTCWGRRCCCPFVHFVNLRVCQFRFLDDSWDVDSLDVDSWLRHGPLLCSTMNRFSLRHHNSTFCASDPTLALSATDRRLWREPRCAQEGKQPIKLRRQRKLNVGFWSMYLFFLTILFIPLVPVCLFMSNYCGLYQGVWINASQNESIYWPMCFFQVKGPLLYCTAFLKTLHTSHARRGVSNTNSSIIGFRRSGHVIVGMACFA